MEILHIENLSFSYPKSSNKAIDDVSFSINDGDFVVVCGSSGCGKTTLLRLIKKEIAPFGTKSGKIIYHGTEIDETEDSVSAKNIGFVQQNPDNQIVTDKVWHELAFGLENLGTPTPVIRRKIGEMASYFGIQDWFRKNTEDLSGGQKQLLNLAAIMVMQPEILILDEPTSQLDPIAAADFIATLQKLNREFGLTIILVEHRLEEVFPIADKILLMEHGKVLLYNTPKNVCKELQCIDKNHPMLSALPSAVRIFNGLSLQCSCPLTVKEGRSFLCDNFNNTTIKSYPSAAYNHSDKAAIELKDVWFRYERDLPDILRRLTVKIFKGELHCILGGNGTGKTTTLNVISGLNKAYRGKILINGKKIKDYKNNELYRRNLAFLPQNPQTVFFKNNIYDDFAEIPKALGYKKDEYKAIIENMAERFNITDLLNKHPFDLSGGEQQKCALAKILLSEPEILLLDEPTKGLDAYSKKTLSTVLKQLISDGITILIVTHDVEFAAENADRCSLFFDGEIISADTPHKFFSGNNFYTTAASRISRNLYDEAVLCDDVIYMCNKNTRS